MSYSQHENHTAHLVRVREEARERYEEERGDDSFVAVVRRDNMDRTRDAVGACAACGHTRNLTSSHVCLPCWLDGHGEF